MITDSLTYTFISCDIVVWNGIITRFGSIKVNVASIRLANEEEKETFKNKQRNGS